MRLTPQSTDLASQVTLDPRRVLRWVYVGRLCVATAILLAAVFSWGHAQRADTLVATLAFAVAALVTGASALRSEGRRALGAPFFAVQTVCDLLVVTAAVHVTGGAASGFAALYILVIAGAALLLPTTAALAAAALAVALYGAAALWLRPAAGGAGGVWLQGAVFVAVALGSGVLSARLRRAGAGGAQLALALARARVEASDILRNIRSGIVTVDADGTLLYANPAASALLGFDLASRLGTPVLAEVAAVAPELAEALRLAACHAVRTTRAEGTVTRPMGRGGRETRIGVTTTATEAPARGDEAAAGPAGRRASGTAIFSDITDSKRLEALHLRAERLGAVAELSASLAHEIKNPLASIRSAVEQLARRYAAAGLAADDDERTLAALVVRESDRLSRLLTEFLDFARTSVSRVERVELGPIARDAARMAAAHPDAAPGVRVEVAVDARAVVDGDAELLHRALFNLALNAVQASPPGGRVRVEAQLPEADALPGGLVFEHGTVAVHVCDAGAGIAPDLLDRLFDPFFTTKPGGSGLGLAVVQRAVDAHRGVVLVEGGAAAGGTGGARFTLLLPRAAGAVPALPPAAPYLPTPVIPMKAVA